MKQLKMLFQVKPISTNQIYKSNGYGLRLSKENRLFKTRMGGELIKYTSDIGKFLTHFKEGQPLKATYVFFIPGAKLYTKKGVVSKKSYDIDNLVKSLNDSIFKRMAQINPLIDDSLIIDMNLKKKKSPDESYYVSFMLEALQKAQDRF